LAPGNLLVVSGASGSGKSSLVKAGLWRALHAPVPEQREQIDGSRDWAISAMTPNALGDPFLSLVQSAHGCAAGLPAPHKEAGRLRTDPAGHFPAFLERVLAGRPVWLLILDQLEELFATEAREYRDDFIALLLLAARDPRLRLVATIRSDFFHCEALTFIEVFARTSEDHEDNVRLLVCDARDGAETVEVAHETLLREWDLLADWIQGRSEALVRRAEVRRDARRWHQAGRPDELLPGRGVRRDLRRRLAAAGLWETLFKDDQAAYFLAEDDPDELADLTRRAFAGRACDPIASRPVRRLLSCLTAPGRTWPTTRALGEWIAAQDPALAPWLKDGLGRLLSLLGRDRARHWQRRRLAIGDLLAVLGDGRPGVGLGPDGLPAIDWIAIGPGPFVWQEGKQRTIERPYRIARYPVTNAQYQAFIGDPDYGNPDWWKEGYLSPTLDDPRWGQPKRPRVKVAWVEAMAYGRWLSARAVAAGLIDPGSVIRLPTEAEWERAARGTQGRLYPWGEEYRKGYANTDEAPADPADPDPLSLRETTAVGLYPQGAAPDGLLDCAGDVSEWCLNKYADPDDTDTSGDAGRSLRGGSWLGNPASARAGNRYWSDPDIRDRSVGFRLVCACPIPLNTEPLNTDH